MPQDDNFQDAASSDVSDMDDGRTAEIGAVPADAGSSAATDDTASEDSELLSVVRDAVKAEPEPDALADAASSAAGEEGTIPNGDDKEPDNDDWSDVPFHKHPRFQQLLREHHTYKVDAERYQNVQNFLDQAGLSGDETAFGLQVMALAKTDAQKAWQEIRPWLQDLLIAAGEALPDDLKSRVSTGELTREAAAEISRARAATKSMEAKQQLEQLNAQRRGQRETGDAVNNAVNSWVADRQKRDPNFDAKQTPLMKEVLFLQSTQGKPTTPEGVRKQLDEAYKSVNAEFKAPAAAPVKPAIKPVVGGTVAGDQQPNTQSTLDIIRAKRRA